MRRLARRLTDRIHRVLTAPATQPWSPAVRDYPRKDGSGIHAIARWQPR